MSKSQITEIQKRISMIYQQLWRHTRSVHRKSKKRLGQVRLGQVRLGQVRLGQVRLGQVRLGQVRLEKVRPGQVNTKSINTLRKEASKWDKRLFQRNLINLEKALDHFLLQPVLSGNKCVDVSETISQFFFWLLFIWNSSRLLQPIFHQLRFEMVLKN